MRETLALSEVRRARLIRALGAYNLVCTYNCFSMKIISILNEPNPSAIEGLYWPPAVPVAQSNLDVTRNIARRGMLLVLMWVPKLIIMALAISALAASFFGLILIILLILARLFYSPYELSHMLSPTRKYWPVVVPIALLGGPFANWLFSRLNRFESFAASLDNYGRRHAKTRGDELVRRDKRPPILILRRFGDDEKLRYTLDKDPLNTFRGLLTDKLEVYGPVIFLMNPKHELPSLEGPSPLRVDYENWREEVLFNLGRAGVIVVIAGNSLSLLWELSQIVERRLLHRTILLIPPYFHKEEFRSLEFLIFRSRWKNNTSLMKPIKALISTPEFESLKQLDITDTLLIRWSITGEPVIIKGEPKDFAMILDAIDLSIALSSLHEVNEKLA